MKQEHTEIKLDRLLARSAKLADDGFNGRVENELNKVPNIRARIFLGAGISWLLLVVSYFSPSALQDQIIATAPSISYSDSMGVLLRQLSALLTNSSELGAPTLLVLLLGIVAVTSFWVRD